MISLARQEKDMEKRDRWTEEDINELSEAEQDYFERKSGQLFDENKGAFLDTLAKAVSAFANSGGGHLLLGVTDDGMFDGLPPTIGRASIKDWLEQKIPYLVDYPISNFRVHTAIRSDDSGIPQDREVVVVDIGDSSAAPHQSARDKTYYHRSGGRSEPAPHFYLELLRQRLVNPELDLTLEEIRLVDAYEAEEDIFLETEIIFSVENVGRVASYKWAIVIEQVNDAPNGRNDYYGNRRSYPIQKSRNTSVRIDDTILPGCQIREPKDLGLYLRPESMEREHIRADVQRMIVDVDLVCRVATESSPGKPQVFAMDELADTDEIADYIISKIGNTEEAR